MTSEELSKQVNKKTTTEPIDQEVTPEITTVQKWRMELELADQRGFIREDEQCNSGDWAACSVGARLQIENPRFVSHVESMNEEQQGYMRKKLTPKAYYLGMAFWKAVKNDEPKKAKDIFEKIQRLPDLLREEGKRYYNWKFWI